MSFSCSVCRSHNRKAATVSLGALLIACAVTATSAGEGSQDSWKSDWQVAKGFSLSIDTEGYELPTAIAFVPNPGDEPKDPLYFVTEIRGKVKVVTNDRTIYTFAECSLNYTPEKELPSGQGETGMVGLCLEPEHGYVYVTFTYRDEDNVFRNNIVRFETTPGTFSIKPKSTTSFAHLFASQQSSFSHQIGPIVARDGHLYVCVGDALLTRLSRNINSSVGKILRMTLDGRPLSDNPFYQNEEEEFFEDEEDGSTIHDEEELTAHEPESDEDHGADEPANFVWAYGFRNPFGLAFAEDRLFATDNGLGIDRFVEVRRGADYKWAGTDWSIGIRADVIFAPAVGPVQMEYLPAGADVFPGHYCSRFYIACAGFLGAPPGPGLKGEKSVVMIEYDPNTGQVVSPPEPFLQYRGRGVQLPVGLAFGNDGLYVAPLLPVRAGMGGIIKVTYDPTHSHPFEVGQDPLTMMSANGCFSCHSMDLSVSMLAPSLDRDSLLSRLMERLNSSAYLESLDAVDTLEKEPFSSYWQARQDLREASGMDRIRTWVKYHLLEPKFDNPSAQMPTHNLSEKEAVLIADFLVSSTRQIGALDRVKFLLARLVPKPRLRHLGIFFATGLGAGLFGALVLFVLIKKIRSIRARKGLPVTKSHSFDGVTRVNR